MARFGSDGSGIAKLVNFGLRVLQFLIAIPIIAIYADQLKQGYTKKGCSFNELIGEGNLSLAVATAAISMITAAIYMAILVLMEFKWICYASLWDMIVMILYAATFGQLKSHTHVGQAGFYDLFKNDCGVEGSRVSRIQQTTWVDLAAFLLWVITFLMGVVCLIFGRFRGSKPVY